MPAEISPVKRAFFLPVHVLSADVDFAAVRRRNDGGDVDKRRAENDLVAGMAVNQRQKTP